MKIYTDASTRKNNSGIAFVVTDARNREIFRDAAVVEESDNNTAELRAILFALVSVKDTKEHITLLTDSSYAIHAIRNGSYRPNEKIILDNISERLETLNCHVMWIKGHCQDGTVLSYYNKQADKSAKEIRKRYENMLLQQKKQKIQEIRNQYMKNSKKNKKQKFIPKNNSRE